MLLPSARAVTVHAGPGAGFTRRRRPNVGRVHAAEELIRRRRCVEDDGDDPDDGALSASVAWGWITEGHAVLLTSRLLVGTGAGAEPCG
jgi:hypothetical protein